MIRLETTQGPSKPVHTGCADVPPVGEAISEFVQAALAFQDRVVEPPRPLASISATSQGDSRALFEACKQDDVEAIERLLAAGVQLLEGDKVSPALTEKFGLGGFSFDLLKLFLKAGMDATNLDSCVFEYVIDRADSTLIALMKEGGYHSELWELWGPEEGVEALQFIHALKMNDFFSIWHQIAMVKALPNDPRILAMLLKLPPSKDSENESARLAHIESQVEAGVRLGTEDRASAPLIKLFYMAAIRNNNLKLTQLFLQAGIDTNTTYGNSPPADWASSREMIELLDGKSYLYSKLLSHFHDIDGVFSGVNLEGASSWFMNPFISECLEAFKASPEFSSAKIGTQFSGLTEAFEQTYSSDRTAEDICAKIQQGELCFVDGGWDGHIISTTFSGDYMAICNRGEGSERGTLKVYKIDRSRMTPAIVKGLLKDDYSYQIRARFYYDELPALLAGQEDETTRAFKAIAPKFQKVGNCSLASQKAAIRFAWVMQLIAKGMPIAEAMRVGRTESKVFTDFAAAFVLQRYGDKLLPGLAENSGFKKAVADKQFFIWLRQNPYLNMLHRGALNFVRSKFRGGQ
jgi:hypothetical protein